MRKLFIIAMLALTMGAGAQDVKRVGNTFTETKTEVAKATKTEYTYKTKDGKSYPIYVSKRGKAFIIRVSKKTGKEYKQYLPEVTKMLEKK